MHEKFDYSYQDGKLIIDLPQFPNIYCKDGIRGGMPVTRAIPFDIVAGRFFAGDSVECLMDDFSISKEAVLDCIKMYRFYQLPLAEIIAQAKADTLTGRVTYPEATLTRVDLSKHNPPNPE